MFEYHPPEREYTFADIAKWYANVAVKFEIVKYLYKRESVFIVPKHLSENPVFGNTTTRMLKIHNVNHFDVNMRATRMSDNRCPYNMYYSIAKYKEGIPDQHLNFSTRDNSDWKYCHHEHMESYDFFLDIDSPRPENIKECYLSMVSIAEFLDKVNCPYYVRFSGGGFHIIIPGEYFPKNKSFDPQGGNNIYHMFVKIAKYLYNNYTELIDMTIYDSRRVVKIPYTIAVYENDMRVCHPFISKEDIETFDVNLMRPDKYPYNIYRRGQYLFNENGNVAGLLSAVGL